MSAPANTGEPLVPSSVIAVRLKTREDVRYDVQKPLPTPQHILLLLLNLNISGLCEEGSRKGKGGLAL